MKDQLTASQSRIDREEQDKGQEKAAFAESEEKGKTYPVKHNKQTVELTLQELLDCAEKGLDYDRIRPSHDFLKKLAQKDGETDVSRYIGKIARDLSKQELSETRGDDTAAKFRQGDDESKSVRGGEDAPDLKESYQKLTAKYQALLSNIENREASTGSLSGGDAVEKDFYSSVEWDRLPQKQKDKMIKNGKIYEFMKKWSVER